MSRLRPVAALLTLVLVLTALPAGAVVPLDGDGPEWDAAFADILDAAAADELVLGFVHADDAADARAARDDAELVPGAEFPMVDAVAGWGTPDQWRALGEDSRVAYLEPNEVLTDFLDTSIIATRRDEAVNAQEVLDAAGLPKIDGTGVGIAIVDSGVDGTHPMFVEADPDDPEVLTSRVRRNLRQSCPFLQPGSEDNLTIADLCMVDRGAYVGMPVNTDSTVAGGHGTHVASIAGGHRAVSVDGRVLEGYAPGADVYGFGTGAAVAVYGSAMAFAWIVLNHADPCAGLENPFGLSCAPIRVTNHSYGVVGGSEYNPNDLEVKLQQRLVAEGVTVVWAAGNDGGNGAEASPRTNGPGADPTPGVLMVANYSDGETGDRDNQVVASSSRGQASRPGTWPDLAAPGDRITAACRAELPVCKLGVIGEPLDPNFGTIGGTSMAAPTVAGIVALLLQADPTLTPAEVEDVLEDTAHKFTAGAAYEQDPRNADDLSSYDKGHGLVDVVAAMERVLSTTVPVEQCTPTSPVVDDPTGDANAFLGFPVLPYSSDALDVDELSVVTLADGSLELTLSVADLPSEPLSDSNGEYFDINFRYGGAVYYITASRTATDVFSLTTTATESFVLGRLGTTRETIDGDLQGSFDPAADTISVVLPVDVFARNGLAPQDIAAGDVLDGFEVVARREYVVLVPDADTAPGRCDYTVAGEWPRVSVGDTTVTEGDGTAVVTAQLATPALGGESFDVTLVDGSAVAGEDYDATTPTFTVTLGAGQTSVDIPVGIADDTVTEDTESFGVVLSAPSRVVLDDAEAVVTITDDDDGDTGTGLPPTLTVTAVDVLEGDDGTAALVATVVADAPSTKDATVRVVTTDGTAVAGEDYLARDLTVTLPAGASSVDVAIPVLGDDEIERDETLDVTITDPTDAVLGATTTVTATIVNDDLPTVFVSDEQVKEPSRNGRDVRVTVELLQPALEDVTVTVSTVDFDAVAGEDYVAVDGLQVVVPAGQRRATFTVTVLADTIDEPDEAFVLRIDDAAGAAVADTDSLVVIRS